MANGDFTQVTEDVAQNIGRGASSQVYLLRPDIGESDLIDELDAKLAQLNAMLHQTYGGGGESFRNLNDQIQDSYLWACSTMAEECQFLHDRIWELRRKTTSNPGAGNE